MLKGSNQPETEAAIFCFYMREIKFRAYWPGVHQMKYFVAGNFEDTENGFALTFIQPDGGQSIYIGKAEVMQFTNCKDKNGLDIYDGDILGQDCRMIDDYTGKESIEVQRLVVRWNREDARWSVYCPDAMIKKDWGYIPKGTCIIGNIYENAEQPA